jgi:Transglutaminase-like superfamily
MAFRAKIPLDPSASNTPQTDPQISLKVPLNINSETGVVCKFRKVASAAIFWYNLFMKRKKSQIETDKYIKDFLGDLSIKTKDDLVVLKNYIRNKLEFRPYNKKTRPHADSLQWKRTASEIIQDGFVYKGKACSDLVIVFLALCKASGLKGYLVKLKTLDNKDSHSIVEVKLKNKWYRLDPSSPDSIPFEGQLKADQIWNKNWKGGWKVWKRGKDLWDLGLYGIESENQITEK